MLKGNFEGPHQICKDFIGLGDLFQCDRLIIIVQIVIDQHCMVHFLFSLNLIPVGKAIQPLVIIIIGNVQV